MIFIFTRKDNYITVDIINSTTNQIFGYYVSFSLSLLNDFTQSIINGDFDLESKIKILESLKVSNPYYMVNYSCIPLSTKFIQPELCIALIDTKLKELKHELIEPIKVPSNSSILSKIFNRR